MFLLLWSTVMAVVVIIEAVVVVVVSSRNSNQFTGSRVESQSVSVSVSVCLSLSLSHTGNMDLYSHCHTAIVFMKNKGKETTIKHEYSTIAGDWMSYLTRQENWPSFSFINSTWSQCRGTADVTYVDTPPSPTLYTPFPLEPILLMPNCQLSYARV